MARVKPERLNIYDHIFSISDFIKMAESDIERLLEEYNELPDKIEEINEFIMDHKSNPDFSKEIAEKRAYRRKLYNKQSSLAKRMMREKSKIKEYMAVMNSKNK